MARKAARPWTVRERPTDASKTVVHLRVELLYEYPLLPVRLLRWQSKAGPELLLLLLLLRFRFCAIPYTFLSTEETVINPFLPLYFYRDHGLSGAT